jgi:hypothetical protein
VTVDDDLRQRLSSLRRGYREIKATLSRIDLLVSEMRPGSIFSTFPVAVADAHRTTYALLQTAETHFFSHEDLQDVVLAVRRFAPSSDLPASLKRDLQRALHDAEALLKGYTEAISHWDEKRRKSIELIKSGQTDPLLFQEATSDFIKAGVPLHERFVEQRENLMKLYGRTLAVLSRRHNRLKVAHRVFERASWFLYVLGTGLAIFGKWLEAGIK